MSRAGIQLRLQGAIEAAHLAGELLLKGPSKGMETQFKGKSDVVTVMDYQAEQMIKDYLHHLFPSDNFQGEETGIERFGEGGTWIIDPIDGTNNYLHSIPGYTISIAYEEESWKPLLGVIFSPMQQELFYAQEGKGAFFQNRLIECSQQTEPKQAVTIISAPLRIPRLIPSYTKMFEKMCFETGDLRNFGSAALHMCYVACGRADAYFEYGLKYHDLAAGLVILKEAGSCFSPLLPHHKNGWTGDIIVSNKALHSWYTATLWKMIEAEDEISSSERVLL